jgi:hemoglobin/transferrin/lactoferrin receptor protein
MRGLTAFLMATASMSMLLTVGTKQAIAQERAASARYSMSIPAGSLPVALNRFADRSGLQLVYDAGATRSLQTKGYNGQGTASDVLSALLSGTGLSYSFTNTNTVTITDPASAVANPQIGADGSTVLQTITVAGARNRNADLPFETAGSVSYIDSEQIQAVPPSTTGDILRSAPGVYAAGNRTGQALDVNIRGLQGMNRVATLVDGAQQNSSAYRGYKGMSSRTFVDPEFIGGIDIEKGPPSGALGSGAMGGVVNMRTITADDIVMEGNTYGVKIKGGMAGNSINPLSYIPPPGTLPQRFDGKDWLNGGSRIGSIALATKTEDFELLGAFAYRRNGNYFAGDNGEKLAKRFGLGSRVYWDPMSAYKPGGEIFNTSQDTKSALLKGKVNFENDQSLELGYIHYDSLYGEEYGDMNNPFSIYSWPPYQANLSHTVSNMYTAKYTWDPSDNEYVKLEANLWHTRLSDEWAALEILTGTPSVAKVYTTGADISNTSHFDTGLGVFDVKYGGSYSFEDVTQNPGALLNVEGEKTVGALFLNTTYKPVDWLALTSGLRYETYRTSDNNPVSPVDGLESSRVNPRVGITVEPLDGLQFFATYAQGWRPPSVRETVFTMPGLIEPNPFLRPEKSENYEFGFNYLADSVFVADDELRFKAVYFDNNYDDYIVRIRGNRAGLATTERVYANIDGAKFNGVELSMSYDSARFFADANFNHYTDVNYCFAPAVGRPSSCVKSTPPDDYQTVSVPPKNSGSLTAGMRFFDESLTVGGRVTFAGERAIKRTSGIESDWRSYQVYDSFLTYKVNENFTVNASVENIFDLYYLDAMTEALTPSPGRTFRMSATVRF